MEKNIVKAGSIEMEGNILRYKDAVLQVSNISYFEVGREPKTKYPIWAVLGIIGGIILLFNRGTVLPGIFVLAFCGGVMFWVYQKNMNLDDYLIVTMNCGSKLLFPCRSKEFLRKVITYLEKCFNKGGMESCIINLNDSKIEVKGNYMAGGNIVQNSNYIGDGNIGNFGLGKENIVEGNVAVAKDDWEKLALILNTIAKKYFDNSEEKYYITLAEKYAAEKNAEELKKLMNSKQNMFKTIFFRAMSTGVVELVKKLIGFCI